MDGKEIPIFVVKVSHKAKLRELLRNIKMSELKLCVDASKEFIKLLKGDEGGNLLREYVKTSSSCIELLDAWEHRQGKPGFSDVLSLISAILSHPEGMYKVNDIGEVGISRALDKFAKTIIEERLNDVCKELSSKEGKNQNTALLLLASLVRRGSSLASDVAKSFDFKLPGFSRLGEWKSRKFEAERKHSTRSSFVGFAMSFLEVGKPGLLRWVLQQREMFSSVLRGLGSDDDETIIYLLSTLRDRVLTPESLVSPGLRSVLFGSVTLDQLVQISGREDGRLATEIAAEVLNMVCTDPSNGLMPDVNRKPNPLKGNLTRLVSVMKKLKATEIECHRDLLLAIVHGRPQFGAAYLDEFPYSIEDHASTNWFAAISLAADLISSVTAGCPFRFIDSQTLEPQSINSPDIRSILKCICPRPFTRTVMTKGLLHSKSLVKHGSLRFVLEALKLLNSFFCAIDSSFYPSSQIMHEWASIKPEIQNEVRILLPDPQVLRPSLSSLNKCANPSLKRAADTEVGLEHNRMSTKKLKTCTLNEETDMLVSGFHSYPDAALPGNNERISQEHADPCLNRATDTKVVLKRKKDGDKKLKHCSLDEELDILVGGINTSIDVALTEDSGRLLDEDKLDELEKSNSPRQDIAEIWGLHRYNTTIITPDDEETYFNSKLLDTLSLYHRAMPSVLQGSDFFNLLASNILALPTILQQSLLSLLIEHIGYTSNRVAPITTLPQIYKHLNSFINLLIYSRSKDIKDQAYVLVQAAMLGTGAFDNNPREIDAWLSFLPGYDMESFSAEDMGSEIIRNQCSEVVSFLCDAVSTTGKKLFKYWDILRNEIYNLKGVKDVSIDYSPLFICVLDKCRRLLGSESNLPRKSMVSLYVSNTLMYLLQTQVQAGLLASLINKFLHEMLNDLCSVADISEDFCEWRPLKNLFCFSKSIADEQTCNLFTTDELVVHADSSFVDTLGEVKKVLEDGKDCELAGIITAFSFSLLCSSPALILQHFPSVISISQKLLGAPVSTLLSIFFVERSLLNNFLKLWPKISVYALERVVGIIQSEEISEELVVDLDEDSMEPASVAFYSFLMRAPFYVLFPAFISISCPYLLYSSKLQDLLLFKLSEGIADHVVYSLRLVLFWYHDIQLSYRTKPVYELERVSEICFTLVDHMLAQLSSGKTNFVRSTVFSAPSSTQQALEMAKIIFCHPAVTASLEFPLSGSKELADDIFGRTSEDFLGLAREGIHKMDHRVLNILSTTLNHLFSFCTNSKSQCEVDCAHKRIQKPWKSLMQKLLLIVRERFDKCISTVDFMPLIPSLYALHSLIRFMCPLELLELVHWMFARVFLSDPASPVSSKKLALSVGLSIAARVFDLLSCLESRCSEKLGFDFSGSGEKSNATLLGRVYFHVVGIATDFELAIADHCLLKAVKIANAHKVLKNQHLSLCMIMSELVSNTPMKIFSHCLHKITMTKAQLLVALSEASPLHLSVFGHLFTDMANRSLSLKGNIVNGHGLSDDEFMMLLPTTLLYVTSNFMKYGKQFYQHLRNIPFLYWRVLLGGFSNWKSYVSREIFRVELGESFPLSVEELLNIVHNSLLGKAVSMMQLYLALSGDSMKMKKRLKLFENICPSGTSNLLDCDISEIHAYSVDLTLNLVARAVTKIDLCRMMIFPKDNNIQVLPKEGDGDNKDIPSDGMSSEEYKSRIKFVDTLVHTWQLIVKKFPSKSDVCLELETTSCSLYRLLEFFILRNIVELTREMHFEAITDSPSFPFIEEFARSCLFHRFEDPATLSILRDVLTSAPKWVSFSIVVLQLLLSHSQFLPVIQSASVSSTCVQFGMIFRPMSSIIRSLVFCSAVPNALVKVNSQQTSAQLKLLEIVKLLQILVDARGQMSSADPGKDIGINSEKLLFLLLSSYGASASKIDLEIYNLMNKIENTGGSSFTVVKEMDYLWGTAAERIRKEREIEKGVSSDSKDDAEAVKEHRRTQFRENLPIDPKLCVATVLHFPYDRVCSPGAVSLNNHQRNNAVHVPEARDVTAEEIQVYDPFFILRFSIHTLSMGFIEPLEFASLGLLAVAIVSISSPDEEMRKLGYETLGRFKIALEISRKRKDTEQLGILLEYLQNGINEPWQRIPSISAMFVAEASFLLLDQSHPHCSTIIGFLKGKPMNIESVPLFHTFFWSTSSSYKSERLWMLRLLCAGLNMENDAKIYRNNSILESLLSFYASPLSDNESKELILQILRKSIKLNDTSHYLVKDCGLVSWLSSTISNFYGRSGQDQGSSSSAHLTVIMEVINGVISSKHIMAWLQNNGREQLTELLSNLCKLLAGSFAVTKEFHLVNRALEILTSTLQISENNDVLQPQITLSFEMLFQLYQVIDVCQNRECSPNPELGLKVILMSTPPATLFSMDQEKLHKFIVWAVSTAIHSIPMGGPEIKDYNHHPELLFGKEKLEESLLSKLLRWLTASVVSGRLPRESNYSESKCLLPILSPEMLQALFDEKERAHPNSQAKLYSEEFLAAAIFYLQQLVGTDCGVLSSIVTALCLLLFSDSFIAGLEVSLGQATFASLCSRIRCPPETNPAWRWSFHHAWTDRSSEYSLADKMDEYHACQGLLAAISNVLVKKRSNIPMLSYQDLEDSGLFKWERSLLQS